MVRRWGELRTKTGDGIAGFTGTGETNTGFTGGLGRGGFGQWRDCGTVSRSGGGLVVRSETIGVRIGDGNGWYGKEDDRTN